MIVLLCNTFIFVGVFYTVSIKQMFNSLEPETKIDEFANSNLDLFLHCLPSSLRILSTI